MTSEIPTIQDGKRYANSLSTKQCTKVNKPKAKTLTKMTKAYQGIDAKLSSQDKLFVKAAKMCTEG